VDQEKDSGDDQPDDRQGVEQARQNLAKHSGLSFVSGHRFSDAIRPSK
jgi:hypothetical protein